MVTKYVCVCGNTYASKQKMDEHILSIHAGDRYFCSFCFRQNKQMIWFVNRSRLARHCENYGHGIPASINTPISHIALPTEQNEQ